VSRIETHNWFFAIDFGSHWKIEDNNIDITIEPYLKNQYVTQGTELTYQYIFRENNEGNPISKSITSVGLLVSAQVGKIQLSFNYDYINPKIIKEPNLTGGNFVIKIAVIGDFLKFNLNQIDESIFGKWFKKEKKESDNQNNK
jgi:hypothetical protein